MSKIFKPEIVEKFESRLGESDMLALEQTLVDLCKLYGVPYTRQTLKAMLVSIKQLIRLGGDEGSMNMNQVFFGVSIEKVLERFEARVAKFKSDLIP